MCQMVTAGGRLKKEELSCLSKVGCSTAIKGVLAAVVTSQLKISIQEVS